MNCREFEARLHPYVDGELEVIETTEARAHAAECGHCAALARQEREFRELLRRQPREGAPPELRDQIVRRVRRERRRAVLRSWLVAPALAAARPGTGKSPAILNRAPRGSNREDPLSTPP